MNCGILRLVLDTGTSVFLCILTLFKVFLWCCEEVSCVSGNFILFYYWSLSWIILLFSDHKGELYIYISGKFLWWRHIKYILIRGSWIDLRYTIKRKNCNFALKPIFLDSHGIRVIRTIVNNTRHIFAYSSFLEGWFLLFLLSHNAQMARFHKNRYVCDILFTSRKKKVKFVSVLVGNIWNFKTLYFISVLKILKDNRA